MVVMFMLLVNLNPVLPNNNIDIKEFYIKCPVNMMYNFIMGCAPFPYVDVEGYLCIENNNTTYKFSLAK